MKEKEMQKIAAMIYGVLTNADIERIKKDVRDLCKKFPVRIRSRSFLS